MKAVVLADNIPSGELKGEWGLSFYISYQGHRILLDTGSSDIFLQNAYKLGLSLKKAEFGVLSHAHYDHADGMASFFAVNDQAKFYLRKECGENCYSQKRFHKKYIGLPKGILKKYEDRIVLAQGDVELLPGVTLVPHKTPGLEAVGKANGMYVKIGRRWKPDDFSHEQSLVFDTPKGLVIFNSCSHAGADVIIREVAKTFPDKKIRAMAGGFHLYKKTDQEVRQFAKAVEDTGIEEIYTGHCTGETAFRILREELGGKVQQLCTGLCMEF